MSDGSVADRAVADPSRSSGSELKPLLLGAGRQVARLLDAGAVTDPVLADAALRVVRMLDHAATLLDAFPAVAAGLADRQADLLSDTMAKLNALGLPLPYGAKTASGFAELQTAQAACLRTAAEAGRTSDFGDIFRRATALDTALREGFLARLDADVSGAENGAAAADEAARAAPTPEALTAYLRGRLPSETARVVSVDQLRGPNSKDILFLEVEGIAGWPREVVMRRLRAFSVNDKASIPFEYELLGKLGAAGVAVPRPLLLEASPAPMGQPFLMMERLPGRATPVAALGDSARAVLSDMARRLAQVHQLDVRGFGRDGAITPPARDRLLPFLEEYHQKWRRHQLGPNATLEHAFAWLRDNVACVDETLVLVHGDFDLRNLLVKDGGIVALLDWERAHPGHPAEDLAYCVNDVKAVMPQSDFLAIYEAAGGPRVDPRTLAYFEVWTAMTRCVGATQVKDTFQLGLHTDFVMATFGVIEFQLYMERLSNALSTVFSE